MCAANEGSRASVDPASLQHHSTRRAKTDRIDVRLLAHYAYKPAKPRCAMSNATPEEEDRRRPAASQSINSERSHVTGSKAVFGKRIRLRAAARNRRQQLTSRRRWRPCKACQYQISRESMPNCCSSNQAVRLSGRVLAAQKSAAGRRHVMDFNASGRFTAVLCPKDCSGFRTPCLSADRRIRLDHVAATRKLGQTSDRDRVNRPSMK